MNVNEGRYHFITLQDIDTDLRLYQNILGSVGLLCIERKGFKTFQLGSMSKPTVETCKEKVFGQTFIHQKA